MPTIVLSRKSNSLQIEYSSHREIILAVTDLWGYEDVYFKNLNDKIVMLTKSSLKVFIIFYFRNWKIFTPPLMILSNYLTKENLQLKWYMMA